VPGAAFIGYDCEKDIYEPINPPQKIRRIRQSEEFGDDCSEQLDDADLRKISAYFRAIEHLGQCFENITLPFAPDSLLVPVG
jgi:hypothetical protein